MEPEKVIVQPPPPYTGVKTKQTPLFVAVGLTCALGTALLVVSILGGIWVSDLKGQVTQGTSGSGDKGENRGDYEKTININVKIDNEGKSVGETVNLDKAKNEEVDLQYNDEGHLEYVSVLDYNTKIYGSYSVADQECYIYQAGDHKYDSVEDLLDKVYDKDDQEDVHYNSSRMDYIMDEKPIVDHSILPDNLKTYCKDKDAYWLRSIDTCDADEGSGRQKRSTRYCCVGGRWRYSGRCCGCRCPRAPSCGCWKRWICVGGTIRRC